MPIKPIDCSKYVIYKIVCLDFEVDYLYVGSTTNFTRRKQQHKNNCNNEKSAKFNFKLYTTIRANSGWDNWRMIKIKDFPCEHKWEAVKEEDRLMLELNANLNSQRASRSQKEWRSDNKEQLVEKRKKYYANNKENIAKQKKKYDADNKNKISEYKKQYRAVNKEKFAEKINCDCGCIITKGAEYNHKKSPKHKQLMEQLDLQN